MSQTIVTNPSVFQGYPVDLLQGLKGMGRALIGDDALFAAVDAYNAASVDSPNGAGAALGPALLTADATVVVRSVTAHAVPDALTTRPAVPVVSEAVAATWDDYDLDQLADKIAQHGVVLSGRVKTPGKLIAALEAAGVTP